MKKSRFSEEQMVKILREADRMPIAEVAKKHGVSEQTIYVWRRRFGKMEVADTKRLKALEAENTRLKKMVADRYPRARGDEGDQRKKMVSAPGRRQQVEYARRRGLSCRWACALMRVARSALGYRSKLAVRDAPAMKRMSRAGGAVPAVRLPAGANLPRARRTPMGTDRAYRLWKRAGLQVPRRRPRRRVAASRPRPVPPTGPNHVWAIRLRLRTCADGQQIKCLTVVDEWTREALAIDVAGSIRSGRVIEVLARLVSTRGAPRHLRSDNGPEFISTAVLRWVTEEGIETAHIAPGKPWQNGTNESFNGKFRDECLSMEWFRNTHGGRRRHRDLATALQRRPSPFESRLFDTERVQEKVSGRNEGEQRGNFHESRGPMNPGRSGPQNSPRLGVTGHRHLVRRDPLLQSP